ncbi:MAG: hypothetical protein WA906_05770, partial [Pacificimonas sp.]
QERRSANAGVTGIEAAFSLAMAPQRTSRIGSLAPADGQLLSPNPLLSANGVDWPSDRYRDEYAPLATYGVHGVPPSQPMTPDAVSKYCRGDLVALPERW